MPVVLQPKRRQTHPQPPSPDVPHRKQKPKTARFQEKRDTLLAAAAARFNDLGVKGATLAEIAGSVGDRKSVV